MTTMHHGTVTEKTQVTINLEVLVDEICAALGVEVADYDVDYDESYPVINLNCEKEIEYEDRVTEATREEPEEHDVKYFDSIESVNIKEALKGLSSNFCSWILVDRDCY